MPRYCLHVLGPVTVRADGDPPASSRLTQPRHLALLAYLVLARPRGLHARTSLVSLLWPDHDDGRGRKALRNALHAIRGALGADAILSVGEGLLGIDPTVVTSDALALERGSVGANITPCEPFAGFHVGGAAGFDHWLSRESARLKALRESTPAAVPSAVGSPVAAANAGRSQLHRTDTYSLYIRGYYLFLRSAHGGSTDDLLKSRACFERALTLDAAFAPAIAGLSNFYAVAARRELLTPFHDTFAKTIALSQEALALDPTLAIPYVHFGVQALYLTDQFEEAGQAFAMAIANEPSYAEGHRYHGIWLGLAGRLDEAVLAMEAAVRLEPDIPLMLSSLAAARYAAGNVDGTEDALRRTLAIDPRHGVSRDRLLRLLEGQSRYGEAVAERLRSPSIGAADAFAETFAREGADGYRRLRLEELRQQATAIESRLVEREPPTVNDLFSPPVLRLVSCLAQLGELRRARGWKMQACAERPALARWFATMPEIGVLNSGPTMPEPQPNSPLP